MKNVVYVECCRLRSMALAVGLAVLVSVAAMPVSHAISVGAAGAAQTGSGVKKVHEKFTDKLDEVLGCSIKGDDDAACMKIANKTIDAAVGEVLTETSVSLKAIKSVVRKAPGALSKVKEKLRGGMAGIASDVRALVVNESRPENGYREESALRLHEPLKKVRTVLLRKPSPAVRAPSRHASEVAIWETDQGAAKSKQLERDWKKKIRDAAIANWEKNATDKEKSFYKTTGAGPEYMSLHEYIQQQNPRQSSYKDALANIAPSEGDYRAAKAGLNDKERAATEKKRKRREEAQRRLEEERQARLEREAEEERQKIARIEKEREREERNRRLKLQNQQTWKSIANTIVNIGQTWQQIESQHSNTNCQEIWSEALSLTDVSDDVLASDEVSDVKRRFFEGC